MSGQSTAPAEGRLFRLAERFTAWTEHWIPDAFIFALIATVIVFAAGVGSTAGDVMAVIVAWGDGFWQLVPFAMQMALIIITGYVLASSPAVYRLITRLSQIPKTSRGAVMLVAVFGMATSWLNWGFSLIFSAILAKETARRVPTADYRALSAASFLGLGTVWAQGLSGSAALQMATPGALQPQIRDIVAANGLVPNGIIGFSHTIFLWQSVASVLIEIVFVAVLIWFVSPPDAKAKTAAMLGVDLGPPLDAAANESGKATKPGEWFEHSPILNYFIVIIGAVYVVRYFAKAGEPLNAITLNTVNLSFLLLGMLLHKTPARLMKAVRDATPAVWGVILQFPFYAGIAGIITYTHLNKTIADFFVGISTPATFPPLIAIYSAALGVFVPSGGSKWVIEAPYVMAAAHELKVHLGWMVAVYDLGEALANLVQPFWMLPILGLLGLKARDVMGYTFIVFIALTPLVLLLVTVLGMTLPYPL